MRRRKARDRGECQGKEEDWDGVLGNDDAFVWRILMIMCRCIGELDCTLFSLDSGL